MLNLDIFCLNLDTYSNEAALSQSPNLIFYIQCEIVIIYHQADGNVVL